jgi:hypothetical protein
MKPLLENIEDEKSRNGAKPYNNSVSKLFDDFKKKVYHKSFSEILDELIDELSNDYFVAFNKVVEEIPYTPFTTKNKDNIRFRLKDGDNEFIFLKNSGYVLPEFKIIK